MTLRLTSGLALHCLLVGLGGSMILGCGDDDDAPQEEQLTDLERGTIAETRWDACGVEPWAPLSIESLGIQLTTFPEVYVPAIDCILAAKTCPEVGACNKYFLAEEDLEHLPECGSVPTDHCEGDVAKFCEQGNDSTWYEASYDCAIAGATCVEGATDDGRPWAECQAPLDPCADHGEESYCDGTRAVVCRKSYYGIQSPWVFDCTDAFGSTCNEERVACEGPNLGEGDCRDGSDNDDDGDVDCDDADCSDLCD